jgi:hypothetical protein
LIQDRGYGGWFVTCVTPLNQRGGFIVILYRKWITLYLLADDHADATQKLVKHNDDVLKAILIAPDDRWAVFLGGDKRLNIYGACLPDGLDSMQQLKIDQPEQYVYDSAKDKACIMPGEIGSEFLLISYRDGCSVRFDLKPLFFAVTGVTGRAGIES